MIYILIKYFIFFYRIFLNHNMKVFVIVFLLLLTACSNRNSSIAPIIEGVFNGKTETIKKGEFRVLPGDTLRSIASRYKISVKELVEYNNIDPPFAINTGDILRLPKRTYYRVKKNDTLYKISNCYSINLKELITINKLRKPYTLKLGDKIFLPSYRSKNKCNVKAGNTIIKKKNSRTKNNPSQSIFIWPTSGKLIVSFGIKKGGRRNDGINILSALGNPVRASLKGKVVYVGNEIPAWGNLVLIRHSKGWTTTYAHLNKILVKKDELVSKGALIGSVGSSGNVSKAQLHFQIRKSAKPLNPLDYLE